MLTVKGVNNSDGSFDWTDALIDAAIFAGSTFSTGLGALLAQGNPTIIGIGVVVCASITEFFGILAIKRKITKE